MSAGKRRSHQDEITDTLLDKEAIARFIDARTLLKRYLVHVREVSNGMDFLFLGPQKELHDALKQIVEVEHKRNRFPHLDFAQVDEYFLFRIVGSGADQQVITSYFDN